MRLPFKKDAEEPVKIGKVAVFFQTGDMHAYCETDLLGYFNVNVDDPENPTFEPDYDTLSEAVRGAILAFADSVDDGLIDHILEQLEEMQNEDDDEDS